jgi:hypothetical protein
MKPRKKHPGGGQKPPLGQQVHMWPTPTATERSGINPKTGRGAGLSKTIQMQEQEKQQMYPTPTERDWKGGHGTLVKKDGKYYRVSKTTGTKFGARLDAVVEKEHEEQQKLWPTPRVSSANGPSRKEIAAGNPKRRLETEVELYPTPLVRDWKGGRTPATLEQRGRKPSNSLPDRVNAMTGRSAQLNPGWVTALMGFPRGWTAPGNTDSTG